MNIPKINLPKLHLIFAKLAGVKYGLGAKAPGMKTLPEFIHRIDCSGAVRYLLAQVTDQELIIPDGSWYQREWCEKNLKEVPYSTVATASRERLFIAFLTAGVNGVGNVGHVWLIHDGRTLESYGGRGIGRRPWSTPGLKNRVHKCFEIPAFIPQPVESVKLVLNGKIVPSAYVVTDKNGDHWFALESELAEILGGTSQVNLPVLVADTAIAWGWRIVKYNDKLVKNRAYLNMNRVRSS